MYMSNKSKNPYIHTYIIHYCTLDLIYMYQSKCADVEQKSVFVHKCNNLIKCGAIAARWYFDFPSVSWWKMSLSSCSGAFDRVAQPSSADGVACWIFDVQISILSEHLEAFAFVQVGLKILNVNCWPWKRHLTKRSRGAFGAFSQFCSAVKTSRS